MRLCPKGFTVARTYDDAVQLLENNKIDILSLDHDLGEDTNGNLLKTGYDLVKNICENDYDIKKIYIHTDNSVGRENMYQTLLGAKTRGFLNSELQIFRYPLVPNKY